MIFEIPMNKHIIATLIALLTVSAVSFATDGIPQRTEETSRYRNTLDIGYNPGGLSILKLAVYNKLAELDAFIPFAYLLIGAEVNDLRSSGTFSVNYLRRINEWLWLGGNINYEHIFLDMKDLWDGQISSYNINALPVMAVAKASWLRRANVSLYSKLGAGVTSVFIQGGIIKVKPAVQLTPVGVEFGGDHIFGFVEGGLGLQGTIIAGLRFPF